VFHVRGSDRLHSVNFPQHITVSFAVRGDFEAEMWAQQHTIIIEPHSLNEEEVGESYPEQY